jgi:NADH-quinone oxidoreductase subunit N
MSTAELWSLLPLLILAGGAVLILVLGAISPGRYGTAIGLVATLATTLWVIQMPFNPGNALPGIMLSPFARFFVVLFCALAALTLLLSHDYNLRRGIGGEEYPATILFATFGMTALACATNLLTLFLGLEGLTFAFYILVAIDLNNEESGEAGLKYLVLGAVAAAFISFGIALIYAAIGTLELKNAMDFQATGPAGLLQLAGWGLLLAGLAFKVSLVPAHLWTPDVYQGGPAPVVALLATGSKGAAFVALLLLLTPATPPTSLHLPLQVMTLLSMLLGNLAALRQNNLKRMLAYSAIAQMGYVTLALLSGTREGYAAVVFYLVVYSAMNLAAFGAIASLSNGKERSLLNQYHGLGYSRPFQGGVLALSMFALAGIPPTGGFIGKFFIFSAAIQGGEIPLAIIGILTAAISVYFYLRVVVNLYMHSADKLPEHQIPWSEAVALTAAALTVLITGVFPSPLLQLISSILP